MTKESVWVIRHKETKELLKVPSGKTSWRKPAHAKNAWNTFSEYQCERLGVEAVKVYYGRSDDYYLRLPKFDQQDVWELFDAGGDYGNKAVALLNKCLGRLTDSGLEKEIVEFLDKQEEQ